MAASVVVACGGGLRKEPPSWLDPDHDGAAPAPALSFQKDVCLCVQIHGTEPLVQDPYVSSPVVIVHCVDALTGEYMKKSKALEIPSTSAYEASTKVRSKKKNKKIYISSFFFFELPSLCFQCFLNIVEH